MNNKIKLALAATALAVMGGLPGRAGAATAVTWQYPCFPSGRSDYYFSQWISGGWGYHLGDDICHRAGTPEYAPANGLVVYSARTPNSYRWGNLIMIEHTDRTSHKVVSVFGHLADNRRVAAGQRVSKGQLIGYAGPAYSSQNGYWDPHLHFGIHDGAYGARIGTYATWVHGYDYSTVRGWHNPLDYARTRWAELEDGVSDVVGDGQMYNSGTLTVKFAVWNAGYRTWQAAGDNPVRLGTMNPQDRSSVFYEDGATGWAAPNRLSLDADAPPNTLATFTATFTSPRQAGSYQECFRPLVSGERWFGRTMCANIRVLPPLYRAAYESSELPEHAQYLLPGEQVTAELVLKNIGELTWDPAGSHPVNLGTSNPRDRSSYFATLGDAGIPLADNWLVANRASALDGKFDLDTEVVTPGAVVQGEYGLFRFTFTAPDRPGNYKEYFQPIASGAYWLDDLGLYFPLRVLNTGYHYDYVKHLVSGSQARPGQPIEVKLALRNTGQETWDVSGSKAVLLATAQPPDRLSKFVSDGSDPWLSARRPSDIDGKVTNLDSLAASPATSIQPGEVALFHFWLDPAASLAAGSYREYFNLVAGTEWLTDLGLYIPVTVLAPTPSPTPSPSAAP